MRQLATGIFLFSLIVSANAATKDFNKYIKEANNINLGMTDRWQSLMSAATKLDIKQKDQIEKIVNFSKNSAWYMRNASLIALKKIDINLATQTAKKLLSDKSLVVRSAAAEVMAVNLNNENKKILMNELNQHYNFHKKNSLWIRKQIAEYLKVVADLEDRDFFVKNLFDQDMDVAMQCAGALTKITGENLGEGVAGVEGWRKKINLKN